MTKEEKIANVKKVALLLRISKNKTVMGKRVSKEETLENHKQRLVQYCEEHGYKWESFEEIVSGGKTDIVERPKLEELLNRLDEFDAIMVNEISRIARDTYIASLVKNKVSAYKKLIITPSATFDLTDDSDAILYNMYSVLAEHERKTIGRRIKDDKLTMAANGLNASGNAPLGYVRNPKTKKLEIDIKTAHIISTAFYLCNRGWGANRIQQYFNEIGYKTKKNKAFTIRAVKDMLKTETYKGFTIYHDYDTITEKNEKGEEIVTRKIKKTITTPGTHPAIIEPTIFDAIQKIRSIRGERYAGTREKPAKLIAPSLIKDLLYCKCCGRKVRISYEAKKSEHLIRKCIDILPDGSKCKNSGFRAVIVEGQIMEKVLNHREKLKSEIKMLEKNDYEQLEETKIEKKERLEYELEQVEKEGKKLRKLKRNIIMSLMVNEDDSPEDFEDEEEVQEIQEEIDHNKKIKKLIAEKLALLVEEMQQPKIEEEIQKRLKVIFAIDLIEKETSSEKINNLLKQFIFKIHYKRLMPPEILTLGSKNPNRKNFPATLEIEYI